MKKPAWLLAVLLTAAFLTGCQQAAPQPTPAPALDGPVWPFLGGRMEHFAATYGEQEIAALEYTVSGAAGSVCETVDPEVIDAVFRALNDITVVKETTDYAADYTESFVFVTAAGDRYAVRFNQHNLNGGSIYLIEHDAPLWKLADGIREAAEPADQPEAEEEESPPPETPAPPAEEPPLSEPSETGDEGAGRIYSEAQDFSLAYDPGFRAQVTGSGAIILYLSDRDDMSYVEVFRIDNGPDASEYLHEQLAHVQTAREEILAQSDAPEKVDVAGLDLYSAWATYLQNDEIVSMVAYAENVQDAILVYTAYFVDETAELAMNAVQTSLLTIEYGWNAPMRAPAGESSPAGESGGEGRWVYTASPRSDGGTEYAVDSLILDIPASWAGKYEIGYYGEYMTFYHAASRARWRQDGFDGGVLFSLGWTDDPDSVSALPHAEYLGPASDGGHYYMEFPTDVQAYYEDEAVMEEYAAVYAGIDSISENAHNLLLP